MAEAWRSLLRTQGRVEFPARISCTDPRSQKRDLGHPSIVSDDVVWGACLKERGRSVHNPAAVDVEGLAGHRIA
jgi:hypothetical protein